MCKDERNQFIHILRLPDVSGWSQSCYDIDKNSLELLILLPLLLEDWGFRYMLSDLCRAGDKILAFESWASYTLNKHITN